MKAKRKARPEDSTVNIRVAVGVNRDDPTDWQVYGWPGDDKGVVECLVDCMADQDKTANVFFCEFPLDVGKAPPLQVPPDRPIPKIPVTTQAIAVEVKCPWCGAKPHTPCRGGCTHNARKRAVSA